MRYTTTLLAAVALVASHAQAQNAPLPVSITPRLDTPQVRVIVATLQPRMPVNARTGHATDRVVIYLDDGVMTWSGGGGNTARMEFHRGDVRWVPASGPYVAENLSDHPVRILEVDLKGPPGAPAAASKLDPAAVDGTHYKVEFENEHVRVLRVHYGPREKGAQHEHLLNRVVLYLNDHSNAKADDVRAAGPATHTEENASDQPVDRIAVDIKSRHARRTSPTRATTRLAADRCPWRHLGRLVPVHCRRTAGGRAHGGHRRADCARLRHAVLGAVGASRDSAGGPREDRRARRVVAGVSAQHVPVRRATCHVGAGRHAERRHAAVRGARSEPARPRGAIFSRRPRSGSRPCGRDLDRAARPRRPGCGARPGARRADDPRGARVVRLRLQPGAAAAAAQRIAAGRVARARLGVRAHPAARRTRDRARALDRAVTRIADRARRAGHRRRLRRPRDGRRTARRDAGVVQQLHHPRRIAAARRPRPARAGECDLNRRRGRLSAGCVVDPARRRNQSGRPRAAHGALDYVRFSAPTSIRLEASSTMAKSIATCGLALVMLQSAPTQLYRDPAGRFTFSYPSRLGSPSRGTNDGFQDRVAAIAFSTFPARFKGEAVLTRGFPLIDRQAAGGLYDSITLEIFPAPQRAAVLAQLPRLTAANVCRALEQPTHLDPILKAFESWTAEQRAGLASVDAMHNANPHVITCRADADVVVFDKTRAFAAGYPDQHVFG